MPKLFEYFGITFFFYSNEHEPIHVHAVYGRFECKAEFIIKEGKIETIRIKAVKGRDMLKSSQLKDFSLFVKHYGDQIVAKWIDHFVYHKTITFENITVRIK